MVLIKFNLCNDIINVNWNIMVVIMINFFKEKLKNMDTKEKVTIGIYRNPAKGYTMYINDIRVYGMEPLFEPPVMSFEIEKEAYFRH